MCCSSHFTKVHVICIILKHHHSRFYISTAGTVKSDLNIFFLLFNIRLQEIMKLGEPDDIDNCLKNLKLKVNFVKEMIIFDIFYRPRRYFKFNSWMTTHMPSLPELDDWIRIWKTSDMNFSWVVWFSA